MLALLAFAALSFPLLARLGVSHFSGDYDELYFALCFAMFVLLANSAPCYRDGMRSRFFCYLADRAYAIYLLHPEALAVSKRLQPLPTVVTFVLVWAVSLLLAEVLYRSIERPFMRLRERFRSTRSPEKSTGLAAQPPFGIPVPDLTPPRQEVAIP
jgi:peptidoglycan/LPS O-acetylase OafA/YrhL